MRRVLQGTLPGSLPIGDGLRRPPRLGVVLRQEFRLSGTGPRKLLFQHLGDVLMELLTGTPQQGLIRRFLEEDMLKRVGESRHEVRLSEELGCLEMCQSLVEGLCRQLGNSLQQRHSHLGADDRGGLEEPLRCRREAVETRC